MTTLATLLPELGWLLPFLLAAQVGGPCKDPQLVALGLVDEGGLTRKGKKTLDLLRQLADLHDLPLA